MGVEESIRMVTAHARLEVGRSAQIRRASVAAQIDPITRNTSKSFRNSQMARGECAGYGKFVHSPPTLNRPVSRTHHRVTNRCQKN